MQKQNVIVVGNGMTSQSFCRWLTEPSSHGDDFSIVVFGEEPRVAYDRVNLTDFFSGRSAESLEIEPRSWYASRNIDLRTGTQIHRIDRANQCVQTTTGESFPYDRLVLATGSRPFVPPIPGATQDGVFVYRTIEDLQAIEARGADARTAAVLGGGLLGLEAAKALRNMGLIPHVVEMAPGLDASPAKP